jgi:hypothetical protein
MVIDFSDVGEPVTAITIEELRANTDANVQLRLVTPEDHVAGQFDIPLIANRSQSADFAIPHIAANRLLLTVESRASDGALVIDDLRVQGQRRALRQYVISHLHFSRVQDY